MRAALVTGAGSGIGRACALAVAARGLHVLAVGRRPDALRETVEQIGAGGSAEALSADLATAAGLSRVASALEGRELAAAVHAAGRESVAPLETVDPREVEAVFATNVFAPLLLTAALRDRFCDGAGIVFVSSIAALHGRDRHAAYAASKAALLGLTRNLAVELAPQVRVNAIVPGPVQTPMLEQYLAEYLGSGFDEDALATLQVEARRVPLARIADPSEVAATVVHLLLDATAITGAAVPVDLGYTAR